VSVGSIDGVADGLAVGNGDGAGEGGLVGEADGASVAITALGAAAKDARRRRPGFILMFLYDL